MVRLYGLFKPTITYEINSTPTEAIDLLKRGTKNSIWDRIFSLSSSYKLIGVYGKEYFQIYCSSPYRNSFAPIFYGRVTQENLKTVVSGFFSIHWIVWIILIFINMGLLLSEPKGLLFIAGVLIFASICWGIGSNEKVKIREYLDLTFKDHCL